MQLGETLNRRATSPVVCPRASASAIRRLRLVCVLSQVGKSMRKATCSSIGVCVSSTTASNHSPDSLSKRSRLLTRNPFLRWAVRVQRIFSERVST